MEDGRLNLDTLAKPLKVIKRIQETPEAVSLVLEIPDELKSQFRYQAGQFVSFFLDINGEKLNRSYSLSTSPLTDTEFKVTVKKVEGGRGSTFLCERVKEGDVLLTTPPAGHFFKPLLIDSGVHYVLFAAGSGITPIFSILKTVLASGPANRVTLVYCNRNESSIIYGQELQAMEKEFSPRLELVHVLSRPSSSWNGNCGRLNEDLLRRIFSQTGATGLERDYYLCGPTEFMNSIKEFLLKNSVSSERVHIEDFAVGVHKPAAPAVDSSWTLIGPDQEQGTPEKIIAELNGETVEVPAKADQSILETLLEAGHQAPYSCMDGACMACMAKVKEGRVYQKDPGILTDDNIANCEALTCQAKPLSRIVKVSYDDL